jgi:hypothetical protein
VAGTELYPNGPGPEFNSNELDQSVYQSGVSGDGGTTSDEDADTEPDEIDVCEDFGMCDHLYVIGVPEDSPDSADGEEVRFEQVYPDMGLPYYKRVVEGGRSDIKDQFSDASGDGGSSYEDVRNDLGISVEFDQDFEATRVSDIVNI